MDEVCFRKTDRGSIPAEESNHLRLQHLIDNAGREAVRVEFDKQFNPEVLQSSIRQMNLLQNTNLNQEQRDLLQPRKGCVSSEAFDITLMMVFFRHLPNLHIGRRLPLETDESTAADLTRIVFFRNARAHNIQDSVIDEWSKIDKSVVVLTTAIDSLMDKIQSNNVVTVIGFSGSGKSTAARRVALNLKQEQKYQILAMHSPKDLMTYYNKANPNVRLENEETPLYIAANKGHTDIVEVLLENECDITICGNRKSPLFIAARLGHTEVVRLLLEGKFDPNILSEDIMHCGQSSLCIASKYGHTNAAELLLKHGADSNLRTKDGLHPLYIASREGFIDIVKLLIDYNADVDRVVYFEINKRHAVMFSEAETIITIDSSLCVASERGFSDIVLLLLQNKSDPNLCRLDSMDISLSPLCISATYGWKTIIKLLLNDKANPNLQLDHQNVEPPLFKASENGYFEIVKMLLKNKADPNLCSVDYQCQDQSPLYKSCEKGHLQIVQYLLESKADQNIFGKNFKTPLCIAKEKCHHDIVTQLKQFEKEPLYVNLQNVL
ncbi:ankyrin-1-like [Mytilus trossulus]|uniref:ankyrin-1-like n=1 Tax=Mytilus trossulus TaxID=6551 RepID=UPI0030071245